MRTLYNGKQINTTIDTNYKVFQIETFDGEVVLVNLNDAYKLITNTLKLKHYWNNKFLKFSKVDLFKMYNSQKS